ncbi:hypothetical protein VTI74DRAFT_5218 [Chaetomium olivicolor]
MATSLFSLSAHAAKEVFAHVIVGNLPNFTLSDWASDIHLAQSASISAFALNIAAQDSCNEATLDLAFQAATHLHFSLFFSFDYLAQGPWPKDRVISLIQKFSSSPAYFKHDGARPFVSTFEGPANAGDWEEIKQRTNAFFVPDWSSVGADEASELAGGVADGLFSFDAWPIGASNMTTEGDARFQEILRPKGKAYMMPVAPWFFTNLPGFRKNWLWRGDELWDLRWRQVAEVQPDFVEILTWNDYGESHYIGPVHEKELGLFTAANAPVNYAKDMSHDGWRKLLPFYIEMYRTGEVPMGFQEAIAAYYRTAPALACPAGGTTGNINAFGETEVPPEHLVEDSVFYAALLNSDQGVTVTVSIGGKHQVGGFNRVPAAGAGTPGVYMGSVPFGGNTGDVVVTVSRRHDPAWPRRRRAMIGISNGAGWGISAPCDHLGISRTVQRS